MWICDKIWIAHRPNTQFTDHFRSYVTFWLKSLILIQNVTKMVATNFAHGTTTTAHNESREWWCQLLRDRWHRQLSLWQYTVPQVTKMLASWKLIPGFSDFQHSQSVANRRVRRNVAVPLAVPLFSLSTSLSGNPQRGVAIISVVASSNSPD